MLPYFINACNSYTIFLLLISAALSLVTNILMEGPEYGWVEGVTILAAVFFLVTVPAVGDFLLARKLEKKKQKEEKKVEVIRDRKAQRVAVSGIMVGDIVNLKEGDRVPADGLFVGTGTGSGNDDGLLLDEVLDSKIDCDRNPFLLSGFKVLQGNGRMIVTSVGINTVIGKEMKMVKDDPNKGTLLQSLIERPISYTDLIALCISILITLVLFIRFLRRNQDKHNSELPELKGNFRIEKLMKMFGRILLRPRGFVGVLTTTLTAVVLGFQHGVSLAITISLSYWNQKVASDHHANPQTLSACGTIGLITDLCIGVSGGEAMFNQMEVDKFFIGGKEIDTAEESKISQLVLKVLQEGIGMYNLVPEYLRSLTDRLLYSWAQSKWGEAMEFRKEISGCAGSSSTSSSGNKCDRLNQSVFAAVAMDSRKMKSTIESSGCAGSSGPSGDKCDRLHEVELAAVAMEFRKESFGCVGSNASLGNRCGQLGEEELGYVAMESRETKFNEKGRGILIRKTNGDDEKMQLHWRGSAETILSMCSHYYDYKGTSYELESNQRCKFKKLIEGMVDSGLHPIAFAYKLTDVEEIIEDGLTLLALVSLKFQGEIKSAMDSLRGAGVNIKLMMGDENKLLFIQYLKQQGHVVAFCGGMTSTDTPALKEANVGITYETQTTEMSIESSDIIFTSGHKGLASLAPLLKLGVFVYHNIQKFIVLQLTAFISGILITAVSTMSLGESAITAIQLVWANLIVCTLGGMMMVMEPPIQGQIARQPQPTRTESIMTKVMWRNFAVQVLYQAFILLIFQFEGGQAIPSLEQNVIKTMIFNTFILCQVFNLFNAMGLEKKEVFMVVAQSYCFLAFAGVVLAMQVLLIQLATILTNYARLNWVQWVFCFLFSALSWVFDRALKFISIFLNNSLRSVSSSIVSSAMTPPRYLLYMSFVFSMFLFYSFSYYFKPNIAAWTRR